MNFGLFPQAKYLKCVDGNDGRVGGGGITPSLLGLSMLLGCHWILPDMECEASVGILPQEKDMRKWKPMFKIPSLMLFPLHP